MLVLHFVEHTACQKLLYTDVVGLPKLSSAPIRLKILTVSTGEKFRPNCSWKSWFNCFGWVDLIWVSRKYGVTRACEITIKVSKPLFYHWKWWRNCSYPRYEWWLISSKKYCLMRTLNPLYPFSEKFTRLPTLSGCKTKTLWRSLLKIRQ